MRIAFVTTSLDPGGAETSLAALARALVKRGHTVQVICLRGEGRLVQSLNEGKVSTVILNVTGFSSAVVALWKAVKVARGQRPDIVQGWMYHGNLFACVLAFACRAPLLWSVHQCLGSLDVERSRTNALIRLGAWLSVLPRAIIYAAKAARIDHEKLGYARERGAHVFNGVDSVRFRPDYLKRRTWKNRLGGLPSDLSVGLVARVHPVKDHETFLRAATIVKQQCPSVRFILAGKGCDETSASLLGRIAELQLSERVVLLGEVDDVPGLMSALDVLCLTSRSEAFPCVLVEAMACELPCVSTDVGDASEIIGGTGAVVPVGNAEILAAAMLKMLNLSPEERATLGRSARARVLERFSLRASVEQYLSLCEACRKQG